MFSDRHRRGFDGVSDLSWNKPIETTKKVTRSQDKTSEMAISYSWEGSGLDDKRSNKEYPNNFQVIF